MASKLDKTEGQRKFEIQKRCRELNYKFLGWEEPFYGIRTKFKLRCLKDGHEWITTKGRFINDGNGCAECSGNRALSARELITVIGMYCYENNYSYVLSSKPLSTRSKVTLTCNTHGTSWTTVVNKIKLNMTSCPTCNIYGYDVGKKGYLYCLLSKNSRYIKIGISNVIEERLKTLRRNTPFGFSIVRIFKSDDGSIIPILEKSFHNTYVSAGLTGFDGCTEWLINDGEILSTWDLIVGAQ